MVHYQTICFLPEKDKIVYSYLCPVSNCKRRTGVPFARLAEVRQHYAQIHDNKKFSCSRCRHTFGLLDSCKRHQESCGLYFSCSCGRNNLPSRNALVIHARRFGHTLADTSATRNFGNIESSATPNPLQEIDIVKSLKVRKRQMIHTTPFPSSTSLPTNAICAPSFQSVLPLSISVSTNTFLDSNLRPIPVSTNVSTNTIFNEDLRSVFTSVSTNTTFNSDLDNFVYAKAIEDYMTEVATQTPSFWNTVDAVNCCSVFGELEHQHLFDSLFMPLLKPEGNSVLRSGTGYPLSVDHAVQTMASTTDAVSQTPSIFLKPQSEYGYVCMGTSTEDI